MKMKAAPLSSSSSTSSNTLLLALIFLMIMLSIFSSSDAASASSSNQEFKSRLPASAKYDQTVKGQTTYRHQQSWNTISGNSNLKNPAAACFQFQRIRHYCPPFPAVSPPTPPSPSDYEIDPRYGVEKRLVPSGPNPLHN